MKSSFTEYFSTTGHRFQFQHRVSLTPPPPPPPPPPTTTEDHAKDVFLLVRKISIFIRTHSVDSFLQNHDIIKSINKKGSTFWFLTTFKCSK